MPSISSPRSTLEEVRLQGVRYVVLLGPEDGTAPSVENEAPFLQLVSYSRTAGGSRLDAGKLRYRLDITNQRLMDVASPLKFHRQIEVRRLDEDGDPTIVETWGFLVIVDQGLSQNQEELELQFRIDPFVFGQPLLSTVIWDVNDDGEDPLSDPLVDVHWPLVFNPEIDRILEGNRSGNRETSDGDEPDQPTGPYVFVSPESIRTGAARLTVQDDDTGSLWTLSEAVHRLCWSCNPDEDYIKNPTLEELEDAFGDHDDEVKNHLCPFGQYLPSLLDSLLQKHGFSWYLTHELEGEGEDEERVTKLAFYRRGEGVSAQILMERPGKSFSFKTTNVHSLSHSVNLAELANEIIGRGSFKRYESTFTLRPGWKSEYDTKYIDELSLNHEFGKDHSFVGRQFTLNEAGDFCEPTRTDVTEPFNFADELPGTGDWAPVRRRFHPCLSRHDDADDKQSYRYIVEWWDRDAEDADDPDDAFDTGWTKVKGSYQVLEHQAGIWFDEPPGYLWDLIQEDASETPPEDVTHPGLFLRITASLDSDYRLEKTATKRDTSPQGETITLYLDLADKFHFREVAATSVLYEKPGADTVDDSTKLQDYVDQVRDLEDAGDVSCSIVLSGADHAEWEIGKLIDKVDGRNITLTANNPSASTPRSLQVVGLNYQLGDGQKTELLLETFRKERPTL